LLGFLLAILIFSFIVYLLLPGRTNILVLGLDYTQPGSAVGRADTIILTTFLPSNQYIGMLSIPRDLWVSIPNVGENRINTAHFYAEAQKAGSGPLASMKAIETNFGVDVDYFVRMRFDGFIEIVDAMGGVDIHLSEPMAGYSIGTHHLTGKKTLAFVRDRQGSDDFFRMEHGQFILKAIFKQMIIPTNWGNIPNIIITTYKSIDTDIPYWLWSRLILALLISGPDGIDNRTLTRDMVFPFVSSGGAYVLGPNWEKINPILMEMFGQ
jgi:LCP family protein required for cell wall assembly